MPTFLPRKHETSESAKGKGLACKETRNPGTRNRCYPRPPAISIEFRAFAAFTLSRQRIFALSLLSHVRAERPAVAWLAALITLGCAGCQQSERAVPAARSVATQAAPAPRGSSGMHFTDVTAAAGIHFRHVNGATGQKYIPETMGSGCAFLDYDGDGRLRPGSADVRDGRRGRRFRQ